MWHQSRCLASVQKQPQLRRLRRQCSLFHVGSETHLCQTILTLSVRQWMSAHKFCSQARLAIWAQYCGLWRHLAHKTNKHWQRGQNLCQVSKSPKTHSSFCMCWALERLMTLSCAKDFWKGPIGAICPCNYRFYARTHQKRPTNYQRFWSHTTKRLAGHSADSCRTLVKSGRKLFTM